MAESIIMPQLGLTMVEGKVVNWLRNEGDNVAKGETIVEIETDKASFGVESPVDGVLLRITVAAGKSVPIGTVIGYIGEPGEAVTEDGSIASQPEHVEVPAAGGGEGERPSEGMPPAAGPRTFISPRARMRARDLGLDDAALAEIAAVNPGRRLTEKDIEAFAGRKTVKATPLARKVAAEQQVDLAGVRGTGIGERVVRDDVLSHLAGAGREKQASAGPAVADTPAGSGVGPVIPFEGIRKIIAEKMSYSYNTIPHVTLTTEVDVTDVISLQKKLIEQSGGRKISLNDIIVKISAVALKRNPNINARLDEDAIKLLGEINIGVAVATDYGLVVPVVKGVDEKSLAAVSEEIKDLAGKARQRTLLPDHFTGGTFTVSNLGMYEIDAFTPIINFPESVILGVGRKVEKPVVLDGQIVVRSMMIFSLSFDHRIHDGAPAAMFLQTVKRLLENPFQLFLEVY